MSEWHAMFFSNPYKSSMADTSSQRHSSLCSHMGHAAARLFQKQTSVIPAIAISTIIQLSVLEYTKLE